jgi:hypothetical protein
MTAASSAAAGTTAVLAELIPAGHLHGSGADVLDYRLGATRAGFSAGITARSARTGAALWSRTLTGTKESIPFPFPDVDRVGAARRPGVLLVNESIPVQNGTHPATLTVKAVSGAGKTLWTKSLTGSVTLNGSGETETDVPVVVGDIHDRVGSGHDLLIDLVNATTSFSTDTDSGEVEPDVLSAVDGSISPVGTPVTSTAGEPTAVPVPDLSHDGLDDIAVTVPRTPTTGQVVAERGDTGATLWTTKRVPLIGEVQPIGFVSHAHTQDLTVETFGRAGLRETLLDGTSGKVLWTHPGECAFDIGRAGVHRRPAVGVVTSSGEQTGSRSAVTRVTVAAVAAHGSLVFRRSVVAKATSNKDVHSASGTEIITPFDDVQPDGSTDLLVKVAATAGKVTAAKTVIVSGRDGAEITSPNGTPADGSLQRGSGTDLVKEIKASSPKHSITVAGYDAAAGRKLYAEAVAGTRRLHPEVVYGVRVTGHHCSDLVVNAEGRTGSFVGLFDAKAQPLWIVRASSGRLTGGHVTRSKRPKVFCV